MDNTESGPAAEGVLDSLYLRNSAGHMSTTATYLQGTQSSFHLSQVLPPFSDDEEADGESGAPALGLRGGPCGDSTIPAVPSDGTSEEEEPLSPSLEAKYLSQSLPQEDSDDGWNLCPDNLELEFGQGELPVFLQSHKLWKATPTNVISLRLTWINKG